MRILARLTGSYKQVLVSHFFTQRSSKLKNYSSCQNPDTLKNMGLPLLEVIKQLQNTAPLSFAEPWDNVGLLIEPVSNQNISSALLTIDLTEDVVEEAIRLGTHLIISYHPNIFKPLKTVTQSTWKERIIVQCIRNNIAVYSPHTTWDAMENGVNDWLASVFNSKETKPLLPILEYSSIGMGRFITLTEPVFLRQVIENVKQHVGLQHLRLGLGKGKNLDSQISTVALCAGSGASVLAGIQADLYLTGEMLHHDVLDATQKGINVILCNHSDSERGYLRNFQKRFNSEQLNFFISKCDKDCLTTV